MSQKMYSISYLDALWRKAVRMLAKGKCFKCGQPGSEAHHIIRRAKMLARWDWRNGVYLCPKCHQWAHTSMGTAWIVSHSQNISALYELENMTLKDWLTTYRVTKAEFRDAIARDLKEIIKEHGGYDE